MYGSADQVPHIGIRASGKSAFRSDPAVPHEKRQLSRWGVSMSDDIKLEVIKKTQESLSKYIKRPPLTEKLLKKPPFRYIHDIITSIMKETGFFEGVFKPEELNSENIKDRESKIAFLEKVIASIKASGISVSAKPSKIVAGLEVTKTNELLQAIGKTLDQMENQRTPKSPQVSENVMAKSKTTESQMKKQRSRRGSTPERHALSGERTVEKSKRKEKSRDRMEGKFESGSTRGATLEGFNNNNDVLENDITNENSLVAEMNGEITQGKQLKETPTGNNESVPTEPEIMLEDQVNPVMKESRSVQQNNVSRPPSATPKERTSSSRPGKPPIEIKNSSKIHNGEEKEPEGPTILGGVSSPTQQLPKLIRPGTAIRPPSARPASARPGAPRPRDRGETVQIETYNSERNSENKLVMVIGETTSQEDDEENVVVIETQPLLIDHKEEFTDDAAIDITQGQEGFLVSKILETKKEIERSSEEFPWITSAQPQHVEIDWESGRKQKREAWKKEVHELCEEIQQVTRSTNPLGKLFDFLQEDIDSMKKELEEFEEYNEQLAKEFNQEQRTAGESIESLIRQLTEVESMIEAEREAIRFIKANIMENEERLINMVPRKKK
ncbi:hypothetical protein AAG570_003109 [Ranatra chinensis]|uniref:TRAF3-interacting protein 1 n=1 Tax=Ranatra chinensis TaxID=642074 RepID=A0ABD0YSK1_9HEMI